MKKTKTASSIDFKPIGFFRTQKQNKVFQSKLSAPRQSGLGLGQQGHLKILPKYREALQDLDGFSHLWVIFQFHNNDSWKPLVLPPRSQKKRGVYATRSPYRPNPIGLSCVRLLSIDGLNLQIDDADLLDGTPIFDIKPYLPYSDSIPDATAGWTKLADEERYSLQFAALASKKIKWIQKKSELPIEETLHTQLEFDPLNTKKKRIKKLSPQLYEFSYRTWRVHFSIQEKMVQITDVVSGYTEDELKQKVDPYHDKKVHQLFLETFYVRS